MARTAGSPGALLAQRWIMGGVLGQSEVAAVYEAEEASRRRFAAIKLYDPSFASEPAWSEHVALTRAVSELPGEGFARAYDCGIEPVLGRPYVASERITFPSLSRRVAERGPLSLADVSAALATLSATLDTAHAAGIVHGGLKPQNVYVSYDEPSWARVTDFGTARLRAAAGHGSGLLLGWCAPEAAAGFSTAASDRYALALLCFFAATGVPWYSALRARDDTGGERHGPRLASERASAQGASLEARLDPWFTRALSADPAGRFASGAEMARSFVEAWAPAPSSAHPFSATARVPPSQVPYFPATPAVRAPGFPSAAPVFGPLTGASGIARTGSEPSREPPSAAPSLGPALAPMPRWVWLLAAGLISVLVLAWLWLARG